MKSGEVLVAAHLSDRVHGIGGHTWSAGSLCTHMVMVFRSRWVFWIPVLLQAVLEVKYFWMLFGSSTSSSSSSLVQSKPFNQGSANIHAKPWEDLLFAIFALNGRATSQAPELHF